MINSSTGPSGDEMTGLACTGVDPPKREKNPDFCFAVCVDEVSDLILGDGEGALDVAGVA